MTIDEEQRAANIVAMVLSLGPTRIDPDAIRAVLADAIADSYAVVARIFGVSAATVRHTWRPNGMPGTKRQYPAADILIWLLTRDLTNEVARGVDEFTNRKRDAETRAAEADARIKEQRAEKLEGQQLDVVYARSELAAAFNMVRDALMSVGRTLMPFCPRGLAIQFREEADRQCEIILNDLADRMTRMCELAEVNNFEVEHANRNGKTRRREARG